PTGSLTAPASGATVGGPAVALAADASDSGSGVGSVAFEERPAGGGAYTEIATASGSPYQATWDTTSLASGSYDLRAVVLDAAGNRYAGRAVAFDSFGNSRASVRSGIRIDNTAPSLASSTPAEGSIVASVSAISLHASEDLAAVTSVTLDGAATVTPVVNGDQVDFATGTLA